MTIENALQAGPTTSNGLLSRMAEGSYEQVMFCQDRASGLRAVIAIHDTTLGPALGGIRMRPYPTEEDALRDVLRLARAMTYKSALAGLDLGGGKSVIIGDPRTGKSEALFRAMGRCIQSLGGRYICATDVGTTVDDLMQVRMETPHVTGLPEAWGGLGDTSILTGLTVYLGMKAGAEAVWGADSLAGRRILVQGAGKVGFHLMEHLVEERAVLLVADVLADNAARAAERFGATIVPADDAFDVDCDVFSPNALGGLLNDATIPRLRCRLVCGGANNQLEADHHADALHARGILYAPDFLVNSGGVISAESEVFKAARERAESIARRVRDTAHRIFALAQQENVSPLVAANHVAEERLEGIAAVHRPYIPVDARQHRELMPSARPG